jgi:hypothetical protein
MSSTNCHLPTILGASAAMGTAIHSNVNVKAEISLFIPLLVVRVLSESNTRIKLQDGILGYAS